MSTRTGMRGEFLTCAAILGLTGGWKVAHSPQDAIDIVAFDTHTFLRVSVKSSSLGISGRRTPGYHFQNGHGGKKLLPSVKEIDIVAHCFIDSGRVAFYATEQIQQKSQRRSAQFSCSPELEQGTWDKALKIIRERIK